MLACLQHWAVTALLKAHVEAGARVTLQVMAYVGLSPAVTALLLKALVEAGAKVTLANIKLSDHVLLFS